MRYQAALERVQEHKDIEREKKRESFERKYAPNKEEAEYLKRAKERESEKRQRHKEQYESTMKHISNISRFLAGNPRKSRSRRRSH